MAAAVLVGCADSLPAPVYEIGGTLEEREAPNVERPKVYIIRRGDTLAAIALEYGLDYRQLALWNQISDPDLINTGDRLRLSPPPDSPTVAVIKPQTAAPSLQSSSGEPSLSPVREVAPAPESARIGGESAAPAAAGQAPIRDGPRAAKYPYSASALRKLRRAHQAKVAAAAVKARADSNSGNTNNPAPASAGTAQAAEVQAGASAAANSASAASLGGDAAATAKSLAALTKPPLLAKSRKRFGIDWSWPTAGKVIGKFTESSKGLDIGASRRAPVYAAADGKAVYVGSGVKKLRPSGDFEAQKRLFERLRAQRFNFHQGGTAGVARTVDCGGGRQRRRPGDAAFGNPQNRQALQPPPSSPPALIFFAARQAPKVQLSGGKRLIIWGKGLIIGIGKIYF